MMPEALTENTGSRELLLIRTLLECTMWNKVTVVDICIGALLSLSQSTVAIAQDELPQV